MNYFEYTDIDPKTGKVTFYSSWITDIEITQENIKELVEVAKTSWKIENKIQGKRKVFFFTPIHFWRVIS